MSPHLGWLVRFEQRLMESISKYIRMNPLECQHEPLEALPFVLEGFNATTETCLKKRRQLLHLCRASLGFFALGEQAPAVHAAVRLNIHDQLLTAPN